MKKHTGMQWRPLAVLVTTGMLVVGCGKQPEGGPDQGPAVVEVVTVQPRSLALSNELPGRIEPVRVAEVRARVAGIVLSRNFTEGADVEAGQVLFRIDPAPFRTALARAEASLFEARATLRRYESLVAVEAISQQDFDTAQAAYKTAAANVESARLELEYATVRAPISGRIGRALVTEGALVGQGQVTELAVIQQINPLYVNVTQSSSEVLRMREALNSGKLAKAGNNAAKVKVYTDDGKEYGQEGKLLFTDLTVDPTTGQVSLRAELPNPDGMLLPGMYVRVHIQEAQVDNAVLVPQQAVTRNEKGNTVMVVAADGSVSPRPVQISQSKGTNWVVSEGLKAGDQVMVDGFIKLGMGATHVTPVPWKNPSDKAAAPAAPAAGAKPQADAAAADKPAASGDAAGNAASSK